MADNVRISDDIAAAVAAFFHGGEGPPHSVVTRVLMAAGLSDDYQYDPVANGPNKETRVLSGFGRAARLGGGRKLLDGLLSAQNDDWRGSGDRRSSSSR